MAIYVGVLDAILLLVIVVLLAILPIWWHWRRRARKLEEHYQQQLIDVRNRHQEETRELIKEFKHQAINCLRPIKDNLHLIRIEVKRQPVVEGKVWHRSFGSSLADIEYYEWRLTQLIENMAFLSRLETPDQDFIFSEVKLDAIVSDVISDLYDIAESKGVVLTWRAHPDSFPRITANQDGLRQVFINLIDNAIKYSQEGDTVDAVLTAEEGKNVIYAQVSDTGPGIPAEDLDLIFNKGYTVEGARGRRPKEGSQGLGLFIVKLIVERHKGSIAVKSLLGEGTTFVLTLPIQRI